MNFQEKDFPIWDPTFNILDSTKLSTYQKCPREFFFSYILGWKPNEPNIHFRFGGAFHEAMEVLMNHQDGEVVGYTEAAMYDAVKAFKNSWEDNGVKGNDDKDTAMGVLLGEPVDTTNGAKTITNGLEAIAEYCTQYSGDQFKTNFVEVSGSIPVNKDTKEQEGDRIYFKMDALLEKDGLNGCWDHKTTSYKSRSYEQDWELKKQVGTYNYVVNTLFNGHTSGVTINGAILRRPKRDGTCNNEFIRIPALIKENQLTLWLWEINELIERLKWDMKLFSQAKPSDRAMKAFARNDSACTQAYGCPFHGFCDSESWANPISKIDKIPMGYHREYWDPRDRGRDLDTGIKRRDAKKKETSIEEGGIIATAVEV